jgi:LTXXQ motif family protein
LVRRGKGERSLKLRNRGLAERSARTPAARALARSTFGGRYANRFHDRNGWRDGDRRHWRGRHHRHIHVIGWVGPLFWPYAYNDFVDYAFWPYAYDAFWPYAYDDVYEGFFGPYAVGGPAYYADLGPAASRSGGSARRAARSTSGGGVPAAAQICTGETSGLTDWPIEQIAEAVNPDDSQRALLNELRDTAERAVSLLRSACPDELPSTPSGRMAAMRQRLETMREAVQTVRPALDRFYASLSDEQKASFNTLEPDQAATAKARKTELSQACNTAVAKAAPTARIKQALRPSPEQQTALDNLEAATAKAAEILTANCPTEESLTPPGRLAAMEARLDAMLKALDVVQPALAQFYDSLSDEQKARFNQLGTRQQAAR